MSSEKIGRARTIEGFGEVMGAAAQGERPSHRPYSPQRGDTFITSWAKSGTTLMQQMFHQLRTGAAGGDMEFDDISRVVPWDDTAYLLDFDMETEQAGTPRGFKSHREYERLPAGMRYVVTLRDPKETFVSFYRFINGWHLERGAVSMEEFMPLWMGGGPGGCDYFTHLLSWYDRRHEPDSLVMTYRWAVKNKSAAIRALAQLCEINLTPEIEELVMKRTTREFMHEHKDKFDDGMICRVLEEKCGIPAASDSSKVQSSGSSADALPASVADAIDAMWAERLLPVTGHADFVSLAAEVDAAFGSSRA
ncbi:sulfotransferase domain-containing protein [Erythrobacter rubeus]|uniref:Sulfotransferase domain-containing protein n=1 Tax=Erythrobacter rubeus TaxID=2760803 RepID=A0ABR8KUA2_9SPHN|nr:sulfotransferase domain-containing protein [Erythrobacter rubeus]MBD2842930.1 sulfotransferase domain-containing protein [Erythrobacter rubeus]